MQATGQLAALIHSTHISNAKGSGILYTPVLGERDREGMQRPLKLSSPWTADNVPEVH